MIEWRLRAFLDANEISAYTLANSANVSPTTAYALARGEHERVSLDVLGEVIRTLRELTGKSVSVCDLLEYVEP